MTTQTIFRTRPESLGRNDGVAIPGFIRNGTYFFTELEVFADGIFECWGAVDQDFLARKFKEGWISATVPSGAKFSIHDVIQGKVVSGSWTHDNRTLHESLLDSLHILNPSMEGLVDFEGEDVEVRNGVRYAKIGFTEGAPLRQSRDSKTDQPSKSRFAFVRENGRVFLTSLRIYADGGIDVHPVFGQERVIGIEEFEQVVESGDISVTVPNGTVIEIDQLGRFEVSDVWSYVERSSDFVQEVAEIAGELKGEPDSLTKCRDAYQQYLNEPTTQKREQLKTAYESVPEHHRMYIGDMDTKDIAVRMIIYGEDEIEGWSHRAVARSLGEDELPTIDVPKPVGEDED